MFVWEKPDGSAFIIDGHQRVKVLQELESEGYEIPPIPVAFIEAEDEQDAREKLLAISSQYGTFNRDELSDWLDEIDSDIVDTFRIVDKKVYFEEDEGGAPVEEDTSVTCPNCGHHFTPDNS